jgi:hypothetical protein
MVEASAASTTDTNLMKYQYDQLLKHLILLQDHAAARTCPYSRTGEACIRKHLMTIEAYAEETIPMEDDPHLRSKLEDLEDESRSRRLDQEAVLCGEKEQILEGLEHWARKWRKQFEAHALSCELQKPAQAALKAPAEALAEPA